MIKRLPVPPAMLAHHLKSSSLLFQNWKKEKKVPPTLLFTGPDGIGKRSMIYWVAQWLQCERSGFAARAEDDSQAGFGFGFEAPAAQASPESDAIGPCGSCPNCQLALKDQFIDFTDVSREGASGDSESSASETIKIEQIEVIRNQMGRGAYQSAFRIFLIPEADRLTAAAANALLKTLEEPPAGWLFFLTARDASLVLPTIVSRAQRVRFFPLTSEVVNQVLDSQGITASRAKVAAEMSQGSIGKALKLASDEVWERRKVICQFFDHPERELSSLVDWAASAPLHFELLLDQLSYFLLDLISWSLNSQSRASYVWKNSDAHLYLESHAKMALEKLGGVHPARKFWLDRFERAMKARQESLAPVNRKILAQDILLPWLQVKGR